MTRPVSKPPATLTALCKSPLAKTPEGLELARRIVSTPRGRKSIQGCGFDRLSNGDPCVPPRPLRLAAARDWPDLLETLIQAGAWIEDPRTPNPKFEGPVMQPLLTAAAAAGSYDSVKRLLLLGANPNAPDENSYTALHLAAQKGHSKLFPLLCSFGADPNAKGHNDQTPLISLLPWAARHDDFDAVDSLLALGADINQRCESLSPLHYAACDSPSSEAWVRALLQRGALPDAPGLFGTPLLELFLEDGDVSGPMRALLEAGANPRPTDEDGRGPGQDEYINPSALAALHAWLELEELEDFVPDAEPRRHLRPRV